MRWLHLTDLHIGKDYHEAQRLALGALATAVSDAAAGQPLDFVLITGDITQAGTREQYDRALTELIQPLRLCPAFSNARFIAAPGNHDLDCDAATPLDWDSIGDTRRQRFFLETADGERIRSARARCFSEYADFLRRAQIDGVDPTTNVSAATKLASDDTTICLITSTTAFFSDKEPDIIDKERAPAPTLSLRSVLDRAIPADWVLVAAHHPIAWLRHVDREPLKSFLVENDAVYLHGHAHEVSALFGPSGLLSLGFGAAYLASQDTPTPSRYSNSFALCELHNGSLHVAFTKWDSENGRWVQALTLPAEFRERSDRLPNGHRLQMPRGSRLPRLQPTVLPPARSHPLPTHVTSLEPLDKDAWAALLVRARLLDAPNLTPSDLQCVPDAQGNAAFRYPASSGVHVVRCEGGHGHILSRGAVERANTDLDLQGHASLTIVSLGTICEEARTTYLRLRARKPLRIIANDDIAGALCQVQPFGLEQRLKDFDAAHAVAEFLLDQKRLFAILSERSKCAWYCLIDESGEQLPQTSPIVHRFTQTRKELACAAYGPSPQSASADATLSATPGFDTALYLSQCRSECSAVRYLGLASVGLRLPDVPLNDLYVEARAETASNAGAKITLSRAVDNLLDGLHVDAALRAEIEADLHRSLGLTSRPDTGSARDLYQRYGNVVLLGDPGSGKTCFVKHEILAYCEASADATSWYGNHLPLFVPLSEASRCWSPGDDLLEATCVVAERRGLALNPDYLRLLVHQGRLAVFFDGIDEVPSLDHRSALVDAISCLADNAAPLGNRFVITSRPAAIQSVKLPTYMQQIFLRGLSDTEVRVLATRLLNARLSQRETVLHIESVPETATSESLAEQILEDCQTKPGIGHLARNPLFLSLLVMIYMNQGRPSAKRHRVYAAAVQTVASVRTRHSGQRIIPDTDLRRRLGAVALAAFRDPRGALLTRGAIEECVRSVLVAEGQPERAADVAKSFVRDVAEATGLLILGGATPDDSAAPVTFMHNAFLEYFAALGLMREEYIRQIPRLFKEPAWREVIILVAGILADQDDVSPVIRALLESRGATDQITQERFLFAFDCALECEVPPETTQRLLLTAMDDAFSGTAATDSALRAAIVERLGVLYTCTNSPLVESAVIAGLRSDTIGAPTRAAYVSALSAICSEAPPTPEMLRAYSEICDRANGAVAVAVCNAVAQTPHLRTPEARATVRRALRGAQALRYAGARALQQDSVAAADAHDDLLSALDDQSAYVARAAAAALLQSGVLLRPGRDDQRLVLLRVLRCLQDSSIPETSGEVEMVRTRRDIEEFLSSPNEEERVISLRMLPWLRSEDQFVLDRLREVAFGGRASREEVVAALDALRASTGAHRLLRVGDAEQIQRLLRAETRDVRIAACRVLGEVGCGSSSSEAMLEAIIAYAGTSRDPVEVAAAIRAMVRCSSESRRVAEFVLQRLENGLKRGSGNRGKDTTEILELLRSCEVFDTTCDAALARRLRRAVADRGLSDDVCRGCVVALGRVARPSMELVSIYSKWLESPPARLGIFLPRGVLGLLDRSKRHAGHVRAIYDGLPRLRQALVNQYNRVRNVIGSEIGEAGASTIRLALEEAEGILCAYREYASADSFGDGVPAVFV